MKLIRRKLDERIKPATAAGEVIELVVTETHKSKCTIGMDAPRGTEIEIVEPPERATEGRAVEAPRCSPTPLSDEKLVGRGVPRGAARQPHVSQRPWSKRGRVARSPAECICRAGDS